MSREEYNEKVANGEITASLFEEPEFYKHKFYIYKFTNILTGEIYIGQTQDPETRWHQHKSSGNKGNYSTQTKFALALKQYGFNNFKFEVIDGLLYEDTKMKIPYKIKRFIYLLEDMYIWVYQSYKNGYNDTWPSFDCKYINDCLAHQQILQYHQEIDKLRLALTNYKARNLPIYTAFPNRIKMISLREMGLKGQKLYA